MIEVVAGQAMVDALGGITAEMAGQTAADAWTSQGFNDPENHLVDYTTGSIESTTYRSRIKTPGSDKPSITGDTNNSISSSNVSEPIGAFDDWVANNPDSESSITGGIVSGSSVGTFAYSIYKELDSTTQMEVLKAVTPVAVPLNVAYVAISQALGVSMDFARQQAELQYEMQQAELEYSYQTATELYDIAANLVAAWWDGIHILFPKKNFDAISDALISAGIGGGSKVLPDNPLGIPSFVTGSGTVYPNSPTLAEIISRPVSIINATNTLFGWAASSEPFTVDNGQGSIYHSGSYTYLGKTVYYYLLSRNAMPNSYPTPSFDTARYLGYEIAWVMIYASEELDYPEGTDRSLAPSYSPSTIPTAGSILRSPTASEDVVAITLYDDPLNTIGQTADPNGPTDQDVVGLLPPPPIGLPVPSVVPSDPTTSLSDPSVVDSTRVAAAADALADSLRTNPPKSSGITPIPDLPNIGGEFPSIVPPSGPGLIHVYNPTPGEFISFGRWLWVTYADASIDKIWANPFDGVIGAFELYATPTTDGTDNIYSGFLTCPTVSKIVRQRYIEIDCGTVIVPEFYGNYFDYSPYSQCYIYLPFIGINEVSIDDIVGHAVNIKYRVDTYNGSCIAMVYVAKNNYRNLCYQFAGNCAVEVPLAGGSQAAIKAGMIQAEAYARAAMIGGLAGGINSIGQGAIGGAKYGAGLGAIAGALGGFATGVANGISSYTNQQASLASARVANKSSVQHSGQFGSSHGAMGAKKPFIIIRNPIQVKVVNYNEEYGFPAHKRVVIGACRGFLRVREVNVISAHATNEEKAAIESALKGGVYVE